MPSDSGLTTEVPMQGLTTEEVDKRHAEGQSNHIDTATSRPVSAILRSNLFTVFNGILTVALIAVLAVGDSRDAVFGFVMLLNILIGVVSELRNKRTLDSLAVLNAPTSQVIRDGKCQDVPNEDLVVGDVIQLKLGDQIPADGQVVDSHGLQIDESALTGESKPVKKAADDKVLSGTNIVAGSGHMVVQVIGADSWAQKITAEAKQYSVAKSEIQGAINQILRWITWLLPIVVILLLWSQMRTGEPWRDAVVATVAGIVGMIPQGLVLLTSMNFGLAAATMARKGILVQELPAVEILARVDVLCLDKTGTLTTGEIRGREIATPEDASDTSTRYARQVLRTLISDATNATAISTAQMLHDDSPLAVTSEQELPFNSIRKWSALSLTEQQNREAAQAGYAIGASTWMYGAPELLLQDTGDQDQWARDKVSEASAHGRRTVVLAVSPSPLDDENLPSPRAAALVVVLEEDIRPDAAHTLEYFRDQGVRVKVISGDAPETVGAIAADIGLQGDDGGTPVVVDARTLPEIGSKEFADQAVETDVFGRVTPDQKQGLVKALQSQGRTVAMTGDGVNDALALKSADLGIAMGNGASATKAVSRLVLLNGEFSVLPGVVAEGRRIIANMERVSSLFLSKTTYALLLAIVVAVFGFAYPFLPRHLTYISWFTIGVPAFFLALGPNTRRYRPGFLKRTLLVAVPSGIILGTAALAAYFVAGVGTRPGQTAAALSLIIGALVLLFVLARPWRPWKVALLTTMAVGAALGLVVTPIRQFFAFEWPTQDLWLTIATTGIVAGLGIVISYNLTARLRGEGRDSDEH